MSRLATVVFTLLALAVAVPAASADSTIIGTSGWQVQSSARVSAGGAAIAQPGYPTTSWLRVRPDDAGAPGTEVGALVQNGRCSDVFFSTRMRGCFGYMSQIGPVTTAQFQLPWWFRTTFVAHLLGSGHAQVIVNGVVGEADVWVNGVRVATRATVQGAYTRFAFDVTRLLRRGTNAVALKLYPNDPTKMFTLDNVDWTQIPPDNNTGIQFPLELHTSGALALSNTHVVQRTTANLSSSTLTLKADVSNETGARQAGAVVSSLSGPNGALVTTRRAVSLSPHAVRTVALTVRVRNPRIWWPRGMGAQPLYQLTTRLLGAGGGPLDEQTETFGIRTITTRLIGAAPIAPHGSRQFLVNGRPFVFRAGGWSEDLFLRYSKADTANQIALIEDLGLNGIRTEGKQMPADFYQQMDRAGIMIDGGFQCCDAWQLQDSKLTSAHDFSILGLSARTIGENLRNHPSVINFSWSDNNPTPRQEAVSIQGFRAADFQEPLIASAEYKRGVRLDWSGEKEGPYDWVPPSYWYDTSHYSSGDSSRTNVGGAWAFDSEASAGDTVPTLDSIRRFLSPFEQTELWQHPDYNQYHANYEPDLPNPQTNGGYSFGTLHDLDAAIRARYGAWSSLPQYVEEAQVQNYETQRAQFEAYINHSKRATAPSTGIVYWQLNKGWPTLLWDLYNNDYDQAGSYFGAKTANAPLHVSYMYDTGTVAVDNLTGTAVHGLSVQAKVYSLSGRLLDERSRGNISLAGQGVAGNLLRPAVPAATVPPAAASTYFVELLLRRGGELVDRNVYWLSTQRDLVDWPKTIGNPQATMTRFANLTALQRLPAAQLTVSAQTRAGSGLGATDAATDVTITNRSTDAAVAFFVRADVRRGTAAGTPQAGDNEVLPVFWSDDDVTLWPSESVTLHATYRRSALRGATPVVSISGWNVAARTVAAP